MCGICGVGPARRRAPAGRRAGHVLERMTDVMTHRGPNDRGTYRRAGRRIGRSPAQHRRRRGRPPAGFATRTATSGRSRTASSTTTSRSAASSSSRATGSGAAATPRSCRTSTRSTVTASRSSCAACSAIAVWDGASRRAVLARDRLGIKPLYYAVRGDLLVFASELKSLLASGLVDARARLRGDRRLPHARLLPGARDAARRRLEAHAGSPARRRGRQVRDRGATGRYPEPTLGASRQRRGVGERLLGGARRVGPAAADERRSARRDAQRRPRLEPDRRADGAAHDRAREDVLGRVRRGRATATSSPTRGSSPSSSGPSTTSSSSRSPSTTVDLERARLAPGRAAGRPLVARLPRALASSRRSTSPSRSRARARTSSSAATASIARLRSPGGGGACRAPLRAVELGCAARGPAAPASRADARAPAIRRRACSR